MQCLFAVSSYFISVYYFGLFSSFFITGSIPFIFEYALCPATLCDLGKSETERKGFFSCVCYFSLRLSVISENQKH